MSAPNLATRLVFEPVRTLGEASIVAGYTAVGTPLANAARQFFIQNLTDVTLMFSFDGVHDHFPLPTNGFILDDVCSNTTIPSGAFYLGKGTTLYVKEVGTPSTGSVYFSVMYGYDN